MHKVNEMRSHKMLGFTLAETAVVMAILGLVLPMIWAAVSARLAQSKIDASKTNMEAIKQALQRYVAQTGRMPCPAAVNLPPTAPAFGTERVPVANNNPCAGAGVTTIGAPPLRSYRGLVPWRTLGLPESTALDGYDRYITYYVSATGLFNSATGLLVNNPASPTTSGITGSLTVTNGTTTLTTTPAVVALVSHGPNGFGGYTYHGSGTQVPANNAGLYEVENTNNNNTLIYADYAEAGPARTDDSVVWLTPDDALAQAAQAGTFRTAGTAVVAKARNLIAELARTATELGTSNTFSVTVPGAPAAYAYATNPFTGTCARTGLGSFPASIAAVDIRDPWGTNFRFELGANPAPGSCSTQIAVVSAGPDRTFGNADDVVVTATPTEVVATITKF